MRFTVECGQPPAQAGMVRGVSRPVAWSPFLPIKSPIGSDAADSAVIPADSAGTLISRKQNAEDQVTKDLDYGIGLTLGLH